MPLLFEPLNTVDDLKHWASTQLANEQLGAGANTRRRYLLTETSDRHGRPGHALTRTERRPQWRGGTYEEQVRVGPELAAALERYWPVSGRTHGRTHQTPMAILRLVADRQAGAAAEAWASEVVTARSAERARENHLEAAADQVWDDYSRRERWLHNTSLAELGGRTPLKVASESEEGLAAALALLAPMMAEQEARRAVERDAAARAARAQLRVVR